MADWDLTVDAVAVGSGAGGLVASLVARSQGLDVLVIEKTPLIGGSTALSGGGIWIPNTALMRAAGVSDSEDEALTYMQEVIGDGGPASSAQRRQAFVESGPRMIDFLVQQGLTFRYGKGYADYYSERPGGKDEGRTLEANPYDTRRLGHWQTKLRPGASTALGLIGYGPELTELTYFNRHPRNFAVAARVQLRTWLARLRQQTLVAGGAALVAQLLGRAVANDVQLWTESAMQDLVVEDGVVAGVVVQREGREQRIRARRGVLLAAGGFAHNDEMRARYGGDQARSSAWTSASPGDTGEVMQAAIKLGAATANLDEAIWVPGPRNADGSMPAYPIRRIYAISRMRWRPGTILVDASGRRYVNESMSYMTIGQQMFARDREARAVPSWLIFDDACRRRSLFGVRPGQLPEQWVTDGFIKRAETLAELAAQCGIDPDGLQQTVTRFNGFAHRGVDEDFHRGERAYDRFMGDPGIKPNGTLAPLERAPYYAVAQFPNDFGTYGGLLTDERARVLTEMGEPIAGLYATGTISASVMGRQYCGSGSSIGPTCTFGYIAMNEIARRDPLAPPPN